MRLNISFRRAAGYVSLTLLLAIAGCAKGDAPPTARVTGTVTHNGKPVPNMMINFMPTQGRPSWGRTDATGHYEMNYEEGVMGVKIGHHKVYVNSAVATIDAGTSKTSKEAAAKETSLTSEEMNTIFSKYGKEDSTKLEVDVSKDPTILDLKLD